MSLQYLNKIFINKSFKTPQDCYKRVFEFVLNNKYIVVEWDNTIIKCFINKEEIDVKEVSKMYLSSANKMSEVSVKIKIYYKNKIFDIANVKYKDGEVVLHGVHTMYDYYNDCPIFVVRYNEDKIDGFMITFVNRKLFAVTTFKDGMRHGWSYTYNKQIDEFIVIKYDNDKVVSWSHYSPNKLPHNGLNFVCKNNDLVAIKDDTTKTTFVNGEWVY